MWFDLLKAAVAASNKQQVANALGISRSAVSLVYNGKYPAKTDKIAALVMDTYGRVRCPYLNEEITHVECRNHHESDAPTSSPRAMRHWRVCQGCQHKKGDRHAAG